MPNLSVPSGKGLCFLPKGSDTCPRLVIEAKLLNCELNLNDKVLHVSEKWFESKSVEQIERHLKKQPDRFWNIVENGL